VGHRSRKPKGKRLVARLVLTAIFIMFIICVAKLPTINVLLQEILSPGQSASTEYGWNLILVNQDYKVPKDWDIELTELSNGQSVDSRIYPDLQQIFDDMRAQGVYPVVASGYRTSEKQQELINEKIAELKEQGNSNSEAKTEARRWVSVVGYSEHQTGLAVDINADGVNSTGDQVYKWLEKNAWQSK
jgi:serine-type D-Ala-D-Ala carboxypeptidase